MEGIAAALKRASRGADPEDVARSLARSQPNALRFSRFSSFDDFEAAGRELGARAAKARTPEELAAINAEANALQNAYNKFTNNMSMPKGAPAFGGEPVSATERAVLESKYPGRYLDPQTGYPQSMAGKPVMRDPRSAEESVAAALNTVGGRPAQSPSGVQYLYQPSRRLGVDGKPVTVEEYGFTPGQRLAQAGAAGVVGGALTAGAMRDKETPLSSYTGDEEDAIALAKAYGAGPSAPTQTAAPLLAQFGYNAFRQNTAPTYTGDAVDAEALTQKYGTRAPAPAAASPSRAAPIPQRAQREEPGILSRALSKVYDPRYLEDKSSRELYTEAQRMGGTGDEYGANLMNIRAADRARREMPEERAAGGAANGKPGKDAALHKALEIIHMMLSRR